MTDMQPKKLEKNEKLKVEDANINDERIPRNLILMYGDTPYIQKAGLEWKANQLFGGAGFSLELEPITTNYEKNIFVFKATLTVAANGQKFVNFGEATPKNTNTRMQGQLLHLAATRAECRVLRMATATGYASYDEVMTMPDATPKTTAQAVVNDTPASEDQKTNIRKLINYDTLEDNLKADADLWINDLTQVEAGQKMIELLKTRKEKKA